MRWFLCSIFAVLALSLSTVPSFAQLTSTYNVVDPFSGTSYPVNYNLTGGTVKDMSLDTNMTSLLISLQITSGSNLTITLPRTVIDAKTGANDDQFFVLVDGADTNFQESKTSTDRTLSIPIIVGTEKVEIIGTQVVPEFGSLSDAILVISIISIVVITIKTRFRPFSFQT
jgi:predicted secreted protein with PEFG-CTERM motif